MGEQVPAQATEHLTPHEDVYHDVGAVDVLTKEEEEEELEQN